MSTQKRSYAITTKSKQFICKYFIIVFV